MASLPEIVVIQASDAPQHSAHLREILQNLETKNRIRGFTALDPDDDLSSVSDSLEKDDMILILLTRELEGKREQIENRVKALKAGQPGIRIAEILVDHLPYDKEFITFPTDLRPIRNREDMDAAWKSIEESLKKMFPVKEIREPVSPKPQDEANDLQSWEKLVIFVAIIMVVFVFLLIFIASLP